MSRATSKGRSAFTLIEMMVALGLAVIITAIVVVVFQKGTGVFSLAHAKIEAIHSVQVALDFLEEDLQSAVGQPPTQMIFLGVNQNAWDNDGDFIIDEGPPEDPMEGVDNDKDDPGDGSLIDEGGADPVDFLDDSGAERHGLEFVTMSMFALDALGQPAPAAHVLYYLTRDGTTDRVNPATGNNYETGSLIRYTKAPPDDPVIRLLGSTLSDLDEDRQTIAEGITQFRVRYYYQGTWFDAWDSTRATGWDPLDSADDVQYQRLPELIWVQLRVVDSNATLDKPDRNPVVISRLIRVGAM